MKIQGSAENIFTNHVLSGFYSMGGGKVIAPKLFEFSSLSYPISNFATPYDAKKHLTTGFNEVVAVGRHIHDLETPIVSNLSGKLYYYDGADLVGACHGYDLDRSSVFANGYNFYQAFYPAGYFSPPYGENLNVFKANQEASLNNGGCPNLSFGEYNELFGIPSITAPNAEVTARNLSNGAQTPIVPPTHTCPEDISAGTFYEEVNYVQIQGTSQSLAGSTLYHGNPIPTSLDNHSIRLEGRYSTTGTTTQYVEFQNGEAVPSYTTGSDQSIYSTTICPAQLMETSVSAGRGSNGTQLVEAPDFLPGGTADQTHVNLGLDTEFYLWHFTFQENSNGFPFVNNFESIENTNGHLRNTSQGTQLFLSNLSSSDYYWQNRQCSHGVDYLPWTFGASIYACPSYHFDVPYYAAIKKFGFGGTRFLNSCHRLNLDYPKGSVEYAREIDSSLPIAEGEKEPEGLDGNGIWSFSNYDNLLRIAGAEERYSNMYALNKGFFLWANENLITSSPIFQGLSNIPSFTGAFSHMMSHFTDIFSGGFSNFISGEPKVNSALVENGQLLVTESGAFADTLMTNSVYEEFRSTMYLTLTGEDLNNWVTGIEDRYAYYVSDSDGSIRESFYENIISGREKRLRTRYLENTVRGAPIDLFPMNHITFSTDSSRDYMESTRWGRASTSFNKDNLPQIPRRYFEGAYGQGSLASGISEKLAHLQAIESSSFYPGFFNSRMFNKELPTPSYEPVLSGVILDEMGRRFSPSGWLAIGYHDIGALDSNFSCFTPIFVQQPLPEVYCKIGQHPTFRSLAVDYHSIPDDKISSRYPEIVYWASKLKMVDKNMRNIYPISYKWLRVPTATVNGFLATGDLSLGNFASITGEWGCLEGENCKDCTFIRPSTCVPTGCLGNPDSYTYIQGAIKDVDDKYSYLCLASGRFGVRISEPSTMVIEDWLRFDVSIKNGINMSSDVYVNFTTKLTNGSSLTITVPQISSDQISAYAGYQLDMSAIPEANADQKRPPPNAGYGDVTAWRFTGPVGYVGTTRSYAPDNLKDTRGLRGAWGKMLDYGWLVSLGKRLNQTEGNALYGYKHLPTCENYTMGNGKAGVKSECFINNRAVVHWSLSQQAVATNDHGVGIEWQSLGNVGELYPPMSIGSYAVDSDGHMMTLAESDPNIADFGIGHWQWGNNLGSIKRFGINAKEDDIVFDGFLPPNASVAIREIKDKLVKEYTLAGSNCGYHSNGLGRNMLYYLEAYERFYILCDQIKKKNVKNVSFICPGLRLTNSAIQYFWLGQPSNTYVERRAMHGPYAYQWRVRRHNRDRNGNGISESFYSMGYGERYSLMYDAPAIFGLYAKKEASVPYLEKVREVIEARDKVFTYGIKMEDLKIYWFARKGSEGDAKTYGNIICVDENLTPTLCDYIDKALSLAGNPDFTGYECSEDQRRAGRCFDPCLSMRYAQGFFPGGKKIDMIGFDGSTNTSRRIHNVRIVPLAKLEADGTPNTVDEASTEETNLFFRSPLDTPHARVMRGLSSLSSVTKKIAGISPCQDGGSDHCNYITPTIHLGKETTILTHTTAFQSAQTQASEYYYSSINRGDSE